MMSSQSHSPTMHTWLWNMPIIIDKRHHHVMAQITKAFFGPTELTGHMFAITFYPILPDMYCVFPRGPSHIQRRHHSPQA